MKPKTIGSNPMCFLSERASVVNPTKKDKESVKRKSNQNPPKLLNYGQESKRETIADLLLGIIEFRFRKRRAVEGRSVAGSSCDQ